MQPRPFFCWGIGKGRVRATLFDPERLHLNPDGYWLWGRRIRRRLFEWLESEQ